MPVPPVRVVLVDDHPALRAGLRAMLEATGRIKVVGEASNSREALQLVRQFKPNVLLLDMDLGDDSGVEVAKRLRAQESPTLVLAYSAYDDRAYVVELLQAGAAGYITKDKPLPLVVEAVEAVARGESRWFVSMNQDAAPPGGELTAREMDVLRCMAEGHGNTAIAESLELSPNTVRNHVSSIYSKLDVHSSREAVAWAWQRGLVGR